jgi:mannose-6-phosphate isomerase-like protein (cupin superfamily)
MTEQIKQIASRIRELREISDLSPEQLASALDIDINVYKDYETGQIDIPVSFLYTVAQHFNIELAALLTGENPRLKVYSVVRKGKGLSVERRKEYKYESLAFNFINKAIEPFMVTVDPDPENTPIHYNAHPGQEFNYVMKGSMKIIIDGHEIELEEGDSIYFDSSHNHAMKALHGKPAKFLAIII